MSWATLLVFAWLLAYSRLHLLSEIHHSHGTIDLGEPIIHHDHEHDESEEAPGHTPHLASDHDFKFILTKELPKLLTSQMAISEHITAERCAELCLAIHFPFESPPNNGPPRQFHSRGPPLS